MSDIDGKMNVLIEEANANYNAKRFKDAARTFEHLISLAIKNEEPEEAIYFAYRAADCWKSEKNLMNRALTFLEIGNLAHNFGAQIANVLVLKSKDIEQKAKAHLLAGECLLSQNASRAKKEYNTSIKHFKSLIEKEKDVNRKINFLRSALDASIKIKDRKQEKELKTRIANLHVDLAKENTAKKSPENLQIALRSYEDALELFKDLKSKEDSEIVSEQIEKLKKKVEEYDPFAT
jgi:hypothetical protein